MPTRRAARERALGLAYECEQRNVRGPELLDEVLVAAVDVLDAADDARLARREASQDQGRAGTQVGDLDLAPVELARPGDAGVALVEDPRDLIDEVVQDLYVRRFQRHGGPEWLGLAQALEIGRLAVANPATRLEPGAAGEDTREAMRVRLADAVRTEFDLRKRRLNEAVARVLQLKSRIK